MKLSLFARILSLQEDENRSDAAGDHGMTQVDDDIGAGYTKRESHFTAAYSSRSLRTSSTAVLRLVHAMPAATSVASCELSQTGGPGSLIDRVQTQPEPRACSPKRLENPGG